MLDSFPILFAILIAVPGLLIPLYVAGRMYAVLVDEQRPAAEKVFAGGAVLGMLLLMGFAAYLAYEAHVRLSALAGMSS